MKESTLTNFANKRIIQLELEGRYSTAHLYSNALRSFTEFCGTKIVTFKQVNRDNLKQYYQFLLDHHKKLNTISTYMRMLRSIYNRAIDANLAPYIHRLFHDVYTGIDSTHKKAISPKDLHKLLYGKTKNKELYKTQQIANLLFQFSGMSFVDFAHMEKSNLKNGTLDYCRVKTGTPIDIAILNSAYKFVHHLVKDENTSKSNQHDYLFSILSGNYSKRTKEGYTEYQSALRRFNTNLKKLAKTFQMTNIPVSSYTFRHSWATIAKNLGVPIEMISESLGHKSIKTTQIYLKGFNIAERTKVNEKNYRFVRNIV